jgi:tetratricopeptide (TPR) repeat protein
MIHAKKLALLAALTGCALLPNSAALAAGTGSMSMPQSEPPRELSPEELARSAYNSGVRQLKKADDDDEDAERATDAAKKQKAHDKSMAAYEKALASFQDAVSRNPQLPEAWNYIGYTERHLGHYDASLDAYDKALNQRPGFPQAIEYRAEAYLRMNRLDDTQKAYQQLFAGSRPLADQLLASMQKFVAARREEPNGLEPQALDEFAKWVEEQVKAAPPTTAPGSAKFRWRY